MVALSVPLELIVIASAIAGIQERRDAEMQNSVLVGQALAAVVDGFARDLQSTILVMALALGADEGPLDQDRPCRPSPPSIQRSGPCSSPIQRVD